MATIATETGTNFDSAVPFPVAQDSPQQEPREVSEDQQSSVDSSTSESSWRESGLYLRFREHAREWRNDVVFVSSVEDQVLHPAYQRIIAMGARAVPLILSELREHPGEQWFWALKVITGEDPVHPDDRGHSERMTRAWLQWGRERNLV